MSDNSPRLVFNKTLKREDFRRVLATDNDSITTLPRNLPSKRRESQDSRCCSDLKIYVTTNSPPEEERQEFDPEKGLYKQSGYGNLSIKTELNFTKYPTNKFYKKKFSVDVQRKPYSTKLELMAKKYIGVKLPAIETKLPKVENDSLSRYLDLLGVASSKALDQAKSQRPTLVSNKFESQERSKFFSPKIENPKSESSPFNKTVT